jgi:hypothetical protein
MAEFAYAEVEWLRHRNYRLDEMADFCGFLRVSGGGFSA